MHGEIQVPRPIRWLLVGLVLLLLLAGIGVWRAHRAADAILARHAKEVEEAFAALLATATSRAPLDPWPAARPASERERDARVVYEDVWQDVEAMADPELEEVPENRVEDLETIDEAEVAAFFGRHGALFERLDDARLADRVSLDPAFASGMDAVGTRVRVLRTLGHLQNGRIRHAFATGAARDALPPIQQQLLLGSDVRRMGGLIHYLVGGGLMSGALEHLRVLLAQDVLTESDLIRIAGDVDRIAAAPVSLEALWPREGLSVRQTLLDPASWEVASAFFEPGWKYLFSMRLLAAETLESLPELDVVVRGLDDRTWQEAVQHLRDAAAAQGTTDLVAIQRKGVLDLWSRAAEQGAVVDAELELARLAVALARYRRAEGAWPASLDELVPVYREAILDCPLARAPHGYAPGKVWSPGLDGDDGGVPLDEGLGSSYAAPGDRVWDLENRQIPDPFEYLR